MKYYSSPAEWAVLFLQQLQFVVVRVENPVAGLALGDGHVGEDVAEKLEPEKW